MFDTWLIMMRRDLLIGVYMGRKRSKHNRELNITRKRLTQRKKAMCSRIQDIQDMDLEEPLHHTATHCNTLQHAATHCNTLQHTASHCITLQHTATHADRTRPEESRLSDTATHYNPLQRTAVHCSTLQHTATHRNTLQQTRAERAVKQVDIRYTRCITIRSAWQLQSHGCTPVFQKLFLFIDPKLEQKTSKPGMLIYDLTNGGND